MNRLRRRICQLQSKVGYYLCCSERSSDIVMSKTDHCEVPNFVVQIALNFE